jgi:hypothetical protein
VIKVLLLEIFLQEEYACKGRNLVMCHPINQNGEKMLTEIQQILF